jgi:hypothetical protein
MRCYNFLCNRHMNNNSDGSNCVTSIFISVKTEIYVKNCKARKTYNRVIQVDTDYRSGEEYREFIGENFLEERDKYHGRLKG